MKHASPEDCPCCFEALEPGADTERAIICAFIAGAAAGIGHGTQFEQALCARHYGMAMECLRYLHSAMSAVETAAN
jgi:hypothetical protein